jgi:hypothetical protein
MITFQPQKYKQYTLKLIEENRVVIAGKKNAILGYLLQWEVKRYVISI